MSKKVGKISAIRKEYNSSTVQTMESGLANKGMTRIPGTGVFRFPYKELSGRYRTGLDPNAPYIKRIQDPTEQKIEIKRVSALKEKLETELQIDLGPTSKFWDYSLSKSTDDQTHVQPVKLMDGDNYFDLSIPFQELTFSWLRVHPLIASSFQAYERGEYPADTQFYVADEEVENAVVFKKKQLINKAIVKFDEMSPEKKRKVARLMGLPITEDTKEEIIYNLVDNMLKEGEFKKGPNKGLSTIEAFNRLADMAENILSLKDLVEKAIQHSIYRVRPNGAIYEGEFEVAIDKEELISKLSEDDNQDLVLALQQKLKGKLLASHV